VEKVSGCFHAEGGHCRGALAACARGGVMGVEAATCPAAFPSAPRLSDMVFMETKAVVASLRCSTKKSVHRAAYPLRHSAAVLALFCIRKARGGRLCFSFAFC
jgi:hypothetical protein